MNSQQKNEQKRIAILIGGVVGIGAIVAIAIIVAVSLLGGHPRAKKPYHLTAEDKSSIVPIASSFIKISTNFGFSSFRGVSSSNVANLQNYANSPAANFNSREAIYGVLLSKYIALNSPIDFTDISNWGKSADLINNRESISSSRIKLGPSVGYTLSSHDFAQLSVEYLSTVDEYSPNSDDSSFNGIYLLRRGTESVTGTLTLIKTDDGWRVYNLQVTDPWTTSIDLTNQPIGPFALLGNWSNYHTIGQIKTIVPGSGNGINFHSKHLTSTKIEALAQKLQKCPYYRQYTLSSLEALITGRQSEGIVLSCSPPRSQSPTNTTSTSTTTIPKAGPPLNTSTQQESTTTASTTSSQSGSTTSSKGH